MKEFSDYTAPLKATIDPIQHLFVKQMTRCCYISIPRTFLISFSWTIRVSVASHISDHDHDIILAESDIQV